MERGGSTSRRLRRLALAGFAAVAVLGLGLAGHAASRHAPWSLDPESVRFEHGRLPSGAGRVAKTRIDVPLSLRAAVLADAGVFVWCWSSAGWERQTTQLVRMFGMEKLGAWRAYTSGDRLSIHLSPEVCAQLRRLVGDATPIGRSDPADALAWSVAALAHEAQHVSGVRDETRADCFGMQSIRRAARLLGRTPAEGRFLATVYWKHWYVWLDRRYRSPECRDGGLLDLRPRVDFWP